MYKKNALLWLIVVVIMSCLTMPAVASREIALTVDGWDVASDVSPALVNNRTMVPIRFIAEELGAKVQWQEPDIIIEKDNFKLKLTIDSKISYKNGIPMDDMDAVPFLKENRTMVPLRFVAGALGVHVDYIDSKVLIATPSFKKKKADYFDLALKMRFDYLPSLTKDEHPSMPSFLMYAFFRQDDYPQYDEMSKEYLEKLAKDNFAMENVNHATTKEWAFDGEIYTPTGWSYSNSCFYELAKEKSYMTSGQTIHEIVLNEYTFYEYEVSSLDFTPSFGEKYSAPMMYVLEKKGDQIKNGMSTIDAIKSLIVEGDTAGFRKRETLEISYYIDEGSDKIIFTNVSKTQHSSGDSVTSLTKEISIKDLTEKIIITGERYEETEYPLLAAISQEGIYLYGLKPTGVVLKYGNRIQIFDWRYTTPRFILPLLKKADIDNDGEDEIICVLNVDSGTGVSIDELHVLKPDGKGGFIDYPFSGYLEQVKSMLSFTYNKNKNNITLNTGGRSCTQVIPAEYQEYTFKNIAYGDIVNFDISNDLEIKLPLAMIFNEIASPLFFEDALFNGDIVFKNGEFQIKNSRIINE